MGMTARLVTIILIRRRCGCGQGDGPSAPQRLRVGRLSSQPAGESIVVRGFRRCRLTTRRLGTGENARRRHQKLNVVHFITPRRVHAPAPTLDPTDGPPCTRSVGASLNHPLQLSNSDVVLERSNEPQLARQRAPGTAMNRDGLQRYGWTHSCRSEESGRIKRVGTMAAMATNPAAR